MKKRELEIINFLYLTEEKYNKIREYRNQEYIREISFNTSIISEEDHKKYKKLLEKKDIYFAYLIINNGFDYGVITLEKLSEDNWYIGDYLVNEDYKYEGGGIVNRFCINYLCNNLNIKFVRAKQHEENTRGNRGGGVFTIEHISQEDGFNEFLAEVPDFNHPTILETKARKMFDKIYKIETINL